MALPSDFQFSQASLQDYVDCERRFKLRYLDHVTWPAVQAEPVLENERKMQRGMDFHQMVQQSLVGVPEQMVTKTAKEADVRQWWSSFQDTIAKRIKGDTYPELTLSAHFAGYRLIAKYDLIAIEPGKRAVIYDWKTSERRPARTWLAKRLQTRVYPYLLVLAGAMLNEGKPFLPEQVEMMYWFANDPQAVEAFSYESVSFSNDGSFLGNLIGDIRTKGQLDFARCEKNSACKFCVYRSLCDLDIQAGDLRDAEGDLEQAGTLDFTLSFEQIGEIAF